MRAVSAFPGENLKVRDLAELWHRVPGVPGGGRRPSLADYVTGTILILGTVPRYASADSPYFWEGETKAGKTTDGTIVITPNESQDALVEIALTPWCQSQVSVQ